MKKLSSRQRKQLYAYQETLDMMRGKVEADIGEFNEKLQEIWADIIEANLLTYNETVQEALAFLTEVQDEMQDYYDTKSEKWQSSEPGEAYVDWMNEWGTPLKEIELEKPDELEQPEFQAADQITEYPEELSN